ncbi:hypothetical protein Pelo_13759 [Pelomyxa schiedti]|nr:hypothetical protein Pelo_13759 [Pelomyxa schiedti]
MTADVNSLFVVLLIPPISGSNWHGELPEPSAFTRARWQLGLVSLSALLGCAGLKCGGKTVEMTFTSSEWSCSSSFNSQSDSSSSHSSSDSSSHLSSESSSDSRPLCLIFHIRVTTVINFFVAILLGVLV